MTGAATGVETASPRPDLTRGGAADAAVPAAELDDASGDRRSRRWLPMPRLGARYWSALCLASVFGADTGDVLSRTLGLGYWHGLPPLAVLFAATVLSGRLMPRTEARYWLAVIIVRTAATNLADLQTLVVGQPMLVTAAGFVAVLAALVACRPLAQARRPIADGWFWAAMLAAGTIGTALGDELSFGQDLGPSLASVCTTPALIAAFWWRARSLLPAVATFWMTVVVVRTWGTTVGDMTADRFGLIPCAAIVLALFIGLLLVWCPQPRSDGPRTA